MKQKYTITVADMELSIISDAAPDEVENIVGMLDRRMRDINLKSPRCTKNEAAILCALAYCSERIAMQEAFKKVEKDAFRFAGENEKLKKTIENMQEELDNLRKDAAVMRAILDRAALVPMQVAQEDSKIPAPTQDEQDAAAQQPANQQPAAPVPAADAVAASAETPDEDKKPAGGKNRMGTMFDLLTFSDI